VLSCPHCARANPTDALFCFHDGEPLRSLDLNVVRHRRFLVPFVFPGGRTCASFDELVLGCINEWPTAVELLLDGTLAMFFAALGRRDLAFFCGQAARFPDAERGLDDLLRQLPAMALTAAQLRVEPARIDLGRLHVGEDREATFEIVNVGSGLLHGTISSDAPWLVISAGEGNFTRMFRCLHEITISVHILGKALRAGIQPQVAHLTITSSGGVTTLDVRVDVPPTTFASGVLAGARTPRQLAEKARLAPREAARLFESGAVSRWYAENGWTYPVEGREAPGIAAVQQFFDALGLSTPPSLHLSETQIHLAGRVGETLQHSLRLATAEENRPIYATAECDQPWLVVRGIDLDGSAAEIHLSIPSVPDRVGETMHACVTITGNGKQHLVLPVALQIHAPNLDWLPTMTPPHSKRSDPHRSSEARPSERGSSPETPASLPEWIPTAFSTVAAPPLPPPLPAPKRNRKPVRLILALSLMGTVVFAGLLVIALTLFPRGRGARPDQVAQHDEPTTHTTKKEATGSTTADSPKPELFSPPVTPGDSERRIASGEVDIRPRETGRRASPPLLVPEFRRVDIEVVFCIDTTGSMGNLLDGAKSKIWSMCNQIASGKPTPHLQVGLVAYRDRGDEYITKTTDLTRDLDFLHAQLHSLDASGGGDLPESVNQALEDAVHKINWSTSKKTLKLIFLVGDAPPHMDYKDDVKYPDTCKKAVEKGILINTIQCGNYSACEQFWKDIAEQARGRYVAIPQKGGVVTIPTPFDRELAAVGQQLLETAILYGDEKRQSRGAAMLTVARRLTGPAAADRTAFAAKSKRISPYDLLDAIQNKIVKLEDLPDEELPPSLRRLRTRDERQVTLDKIAAKRARLFTEALELEAKRAAMIAREMSRRRLSKDSFDTQVLDLLRTQARKFAIDY
jgi:Mg-chelatase subunit ChlD